MDTTFWLLSQVTLSSYIKAVEQLDISEKQVLRIQPNSSDAAKFMNMMKSDIVSCYNGIEKDHCCFRWQYYGSQPINFEALKQYQTPQEELQMQLSVQNQLSHGVVSKLDNPKKGILIRIIMVI